MVRGADSSRIGSGALGGALVLRTLEPEDLIGEGRDWGGVAKTTYDSEDKSVGGSLAVATDTPLPPGTPVRIEIAETAPQLRLTIAFWPIFSGLALAAVAAAFRYGEELQRDTAGLV